MNLIFFSQHLNIAMCKLYKLNGCEIVRHTICIKKAKEHAKKPNMFPINLAVKVFADDFCANN